MIFTGNLTATSSDNRPQGRFYQKSLHNYNRRITLSH